MMRDGALADLTRQRFFNQHIDDGRQRLIALSKML